MASLYKNNDIWYLADVASPKLSEPKPIGEIITPVLPSDRY